MTRFLARVGRFEAPVDYGEIYPWLQRVRALAALAILGITTAAGFLGMAGALLPSALAAGVAIHAFWRSLTPHSPTEILIIDAAVIAVGMGTSVEAYTGLVAATAYLIAGSITFGGLIALISSLGTFAVAVGVRPLLPIPSPSEMPTAGRALTWLTVAVFLGAVALSLLAAAREVYHARSAHGAALDAERRAAEMKIEFVSMITHELRTPLTNISGFTDTLHDTWRMLPEEDIDEFLNIVASESQHLQNLVEDLLTLPRLEAGHLLLDTTDFALGSAAYKVVDLLFPGTADTSAAVSIGSNVMVHADPNRVDQVLRNLVENARKYGGDSVSVEAIPQGDDWQVVVADNGQGLPAEAQGRVFEAFEQVTSGDSRSESGFGLGLAVARHLVEAMGGRIWYEPGFPVGARFCFTLPKAKSDVIGGESKVA